VEYFSLYLK